MKATTPTLTARDYASSAEILLNRHRYVPALVCAQRAFAMESNNAVVCFDLGNALYCNQQYVEAENYLRQSLNIDSTMYAAWHTRALNAMCLRAFDIMEHCFDRLIAIRPHQAEPLVDRALARLYRGWWREGFLDYEARITWRPSFYPHCGLPRWNPGESGQHVWCYQEQGGGDIIQFARYLPWLAQQCKAVTFDAPPEMMKLLGGLFPNITLRQWQPTKAPKDATCYVPLGSLPLHHGTTPDSVPPNPLNFRHKGVAQAVNFPDPPQGSTKVGICWAGNPVHGRDAERSVALEKLLPLANDPDVQLYSLQVGRRGDDINLIGAQSLVYDLGKELTSWEITAGALCHLDLVISVDSAVAHLAGAMGIRTWLLLPEPADWRWGHSGSQTPWYPSMRLFRQEVPGDWTTPISKILEL